MLPWAPIFIALIYSFHPWLGHLSLIGGAILVVITLMNQWLTRKPEAEANAAMMDGDGFAETIRQQGDMIQALGMRRAVQERWQTISGDEVQALALRSRHSSPPPTA